MELVEDQRVKPAPRAFDRGGKVGVRFTQHADKYNAGEVAYFSPEDAALFVETHGVGEYLKGASKSPDEPDANTVQYALPFTLTAKGGGMYDLIDALGVIAWNGRGKAEADKMKASLEATAAEQPLEAIGAQDGIKQPNSGDAADELE